MGNEFCLNRPTAPQTYSSPQALLIPTRIPKNPTLAGACGGGEGVHQTIKKGHRSEGLAKYQISVQIYIQ